MIAQDYNAFFVKGKWIPWMIKHLQIILKEKYSNIKLLCYSVPIYNMQKGETYRKWIKGMESCNNMWTYHTQQF